MTPAEALHAYTIGSAHAVHEERSEATLARGMLGTVLSGDLLSVVPEHIAELSVGTTVVGGQVLPDTVP